MESKFNINTSQNVSIELKIAGVGDRLVAIIIDGLILVAFIILFALLFMSFHIADNYQIIIIAAYSFIMTFYHFFMEWLFKGQTIGKKYRNIKVMHKSGTEASVFQLLIRNLVRLVDSIYGLGLLLVFLTNKSQRLGDLAAGTIVVKHSNKVELKSTAFVTISEDYQPVFDKVGILKLDTKDIEMIKEVINRSSENMNWKLIGTLAESLKVKSGLDSKKLNSHDFLQTVLKDFQYYQSI